MTQMKRSQIQNFSVCAQSILGLFIENIKFRYRSLVIVLHHPHQNVIRSWVEKHSMFMQGIHRMIISILVRSFYGHFVLNWEEGATFLVLHWIYVEIQVTGFGNAQAIGSCIMSFFLKYSLKALFSNCVPSFPFFIFLTNDYGQS